MRWVRPLSRFGLIARGVTFVILAVLVLRSGLFFGARNDAGQPGVEDALEALRDYPAGWLILLVVALGLMAFGVYSLAEARYRRVDSPRELG